MSWFKWSNVSVSMVAFFLLITLDGCSEAQNSDKPAENEAAAIEAVVKKALSEIENHYCRTKDKKLICDKKDPVQRDAHAKGHGCVRAVFQVDPDIAPDLKFGTFAKPGKEFKAWVRFSNGSFASGSDTGFDGRGMAIKILGVAPNVPANKKPVSQHDILMINHPVFFSPNPVDYLDFANAGGLTGDGFGLLRYFLWRIPQALIAIKIASKEIVSPLKAEYFSMAPFALGAERAVKYSSRPCAGSADIADPKIDKTHRDYLKLAMDSELKAGSACMELLAQVGADSMPIEDVTVEWSQSEAPFRRIGLIKIPKQTFSDKNRMDFCEHTAFDPSNAPTANKPMGGLNRMRDAVYKAISKFRHSKNATSIPNPNIAWDAQ